MFGHLAVLPIDLHTHCAGKKTFVIERSDVDIEEHFEDWRKILDTTKTNNYSYCPERQNEQYDCKHINPNIFKNGALVLKKDRKEKMCWWKNGFEMAWSLAIR